MKHLTVLAFLILTQATPPLPRQAADNGAYSSTTDVNHREGTKKETIPASIQYPIGPVSATGNRDEETSKGEQSHVIVDRLPRKDWWDKFYICLTATLVIIGGFTLVAIWYQAIQTKIAAEATTDAAKATKIGTEALISSERGFIVAELVPFCVRGGDNRWYFSDSKLPLSQEDIINNIWLIHRIQFTNLGRTPAFIQNLRYEYSVGTEKGTHYEKPVEMWIAGGDSKPLIGEDINLIDVMLNFWESIENTTVTAIIEGTVEYSHIFEKDIMIPADFCYSYSPSRECFVRRHKRDAEGQTK
jgi:hypothetical protein